MICLEADTIIRAVVIEKLLPSSNQSDSSALWYKNKYYIAKNTTYSLFLYIHGIIPVLCDCQVNLLHVLLFLFCINGKHCLSVHSWSQVTCSGGPFVTAKRERQVRSVQVFSLLFLSVSDPSNRPEALHMDPWWMGSIWGLPTD